MKNFKDIIIIIFAVIGFTSILFSFTSLNQPEKVDVIILKLMGKKLESAYVIDQGREDKTRDGLTGDEALESYLNNGWEIKGSTTASDAGRFSVVYTLVRNLN
ncbi:hypothetical protein N8873_02185 [Flavobacteriaceae bacterium]|nr:hypothetical protein [Flavobacteriaceae bacterium]